MTVRVNTRRGPDAGAYYVDPERRGLAYYLDAGEPPGLWFGKQANAWGLHGEVCPEVFLSLMDGAGPSGDQLGRAYGERSVRGYDYHVLGSEVGVHPVGARPGCPKMCSTSSRSGRARLRPRLERKLDRFRATFDRDPTPQEAWRLEREAVLDSRPAKQYPGERVDLRGEWAERASRDSASTPGEWSTTPLGDSPHPAEVQVAMVDQGLGALTESQSTWRPNELLMELARAVPTTIHAPPAELVATLERLTENVLDEHCVDLTPAGDGPLRESDGRPTSESILDRRFNTQEVLDEELAISDWADERWSPCRGGRHRR